MVLLVYKLPVAVLALEFVYKTCLKFSATFSPSVRCLHKAVHLAG